MAGATAEAREGVHEGEGGPLTTLFAYGTLMSGFKNHVNVLRSRHTSIEPAVLPGAELYHFTAAGFPGAWRCPPDESSSRSITGEVITVPPEAWADVLRELDLLEDYYGPGHPSNMYERVAVSVVTRDGTPRLAWGYLCLLDRGAAVHVAHGDWRRFVVEGAVEDAGDDWADVLKRAGAAAAAVEPGVTPTTQSEQAV